eukprot:1978799-Pleurochrysis_carterae.AAC.3
MFALTATLARNVNGGDQSSATNYGDERLEWTLDRACSSCRDCLWHIQLGRVTPHASLMPLEQTLLNRLVVGVDL